MRSLNTARSRRAILYAASAALLLAAVGVVVGRARVAHDGAPSRPDGGDARVDAAEPDAAANDATGAAERNDRGGIDAATARACPVHGARESARLERAHKGFAVTLGSDADLLPCVDTPGGAWGVTILSFEGSPAAAPGEEPHAEGTWALVHLDPRGAIDGKSSVVGHVRDGSDVTDVAVDRFASGRCYETVKLSLAPDLDGDGEPEVVVDAQSGGDECAVESKRALYTHHAGRVFPFAALRGERVERFEDVTGDGLQDAVTWPFAYPGPFSEVTGTPSTYSAAIEAAIPLTGDGGARRGNDAARAFVARQCTAPGRGLGRVRASDPENDPESAARAVACARFEGVTSIAILQVLSGRCARYYHGNPPRPHEDRTCPGWLPAIAQAEPPFAIATARPEDAPPLDDAATAESPAGGGGIAGEVGDSGARPDPSSARPRRDLR